MTDAVHTAPDRPWVVDGDVAARGAAFFDGELLRGTDLAAHVAGADTLAAFADRLDALNGFFGVVVERADETFVGVDHVRSVPLLYAPAEGVVSDDARWLVDRLGAPAFDPAAESELLVAGSVLDDRTLVPGMWTVRPGEAVRLRDGSAESVRYTEYAPRTDDAAAGGAEASGGDGLEAALDAAFDRFARVIGDRQVALPLSGGYDSRLIATELAERDCDLLTFSFGTPDAEDVRVARDVAAALDVPWEFVEYTTDRWAEWYRSPERPAFVDSAFTYDAIPNYGTVPALSELRASGVVDADAVCTSGQTVAGMSENVPRELDVPAPTRADLVDAVVDYWRRWQWNDPAFDAHVRSRIEAMLPPDDVGTLPAAFAAYERWKLADRHVKYFVADVRQYDFHGLDWWLPLWDREVVAAWERVPFARRREKQRFCEEIDRRFAAAAGIDRGEAASFATETTAPSLAGRAVDWVAEHAVDSPVAPLLAPVYWRLQRRRSDYGDHPLGWYGIVPPDLFAQLYSGREDVHFLQTLEAVGRASFVDGTVENPPRDGVVSVPYTAE